MDLLEEDEDRPVHHGVSLATRQVGHTMVLLVPLMELVRVLMQMQIYFRAGRESRQQYRRLPLGSGSSPGSAWR